VIIANYNGLSIPHPNLTDSLKALASQSYTDYETIIVDNGSTDMSVEYISTQYPQMKTLKLTRNYGFAPANNVGFAASTGEYIVLLNNDAVPLEGWLAELVQQAEMNPTFKILASIQLPDQYPRKTRNLNVYGTPGIHDPEVTSAILPSLFASGAAFLVRRSWIGKLGYLFDNSFITTAEDLDLSIRTILSGGKIGYVVSSRVIHHAGTTMKFYRMEYAYLATRNELISYFRVLSPPSFAKILAVRFVYILARIVGRSREIRRNLGMLAGLIAGILYIPLNLQKRRDFHRIKSVSDRFLFMNLKFKSSSTLGRLLWIFLNGPRESGGS
jgi:hypothetical protein